MKRIAYRFLAAISTPSARAGTPRAGTPRVGTGALARPRLRRDSRPGCPSRAKLGSCLRSRQLWTWQSLQCAALMTLVVALTNATAETRPHYGGTLRVMLQSAPSALD